MIWATQEHHIVHLPQRLSQAWDHEVLNAHEAAKCVPLMAKLLLLSAPLVLVNACSLDSTWVCWKLSLGSMAN